MYIFILAGLAALLAVAWWRIFAKAGYGGWMGPLMLIPGVNVLLIMVLAFTEWPISAELRHLREQEERDRLENRGL